MTAPDRRDARAALTHELQQARASLVAKVDGLSEREARLPRTPTGTSLAGIVLHCANVEIVYFGTTFDRAWPEPEHPCFVDDARYEADPQADWLLPPEVPLAELIAFYRRVWTFADATIGATSLDGVGHVPHWGRAEVTLQWMLVHTMGDLIRHAGQADILREGVDGSVGWRTPGDNIPDGVDWPAYLARARAIAESFPP